MDFICKSCFHKHRPVHHDKWSADIIQFLQATGANKAARRSSRVCVQIDEVQYRILCYMCVQSDEVEYTVLCYVCVQIDEVQHSFVLGMCPE
jgi:hypothetical protein